MTSNGVNAIHFMTTFFEHQRFAYKRNYLRNLIFLALSDGKLDEIEQALIFRIGMKRGLDEWQITEILTEELSEEILIPESVANRMNLLFDLMQILYADGHVNTGEIEFLRSVISRSSLEEETMYDLLKLFEHNTPSPEAWQDFLNVTIDKNTAVRSRQ